MNRVGGKTNPYLSNSGLDTNVIGANASQYSKWLIKGAQQSMSSKDRSISTGISFLRDLAERLNIIESTFLKACEVLKKVDDAEVAKMQKLHVKCATIMFMACRMTNNPKELKDILRATGTGHKEISKCYKKMKPVLPGSLLSQSSSKHAEDASKKLGLDKEVSEICKATADNISKLEVLTGKKPATIAGVAIYMIIRRSPRYSSTIGSSEIAEMLGMGEAAIKNGYKEIEDYEDDILPIGFV